MRSAVAACVCDLTGPFDVFQPTISHSGRSCWPTPSPPSSAHPTIYSVAFLQLYNHLGYPKSVPSNGWVSSQRAWWWTVRCWWRRPRRGTGPSCRLPRVGGDPEHGDEPGCGGHRAECAAAARWVARLRRPGTGLRRAGTLGAAASRAMSAGPATRKRPSPTSAARCCGRRDLGPRPRTTPTTGPWSTGGRMRAGRAAAAAISARPVPRAPRGGDQARHLAGDNKASRAAMATAAPRTFFGRDGAEWLLEACGGRVWEPVWWLWLRHGPGGDLPTAPRIAGKGSLGESPRAPGWVQVERAGRRHRARSAESSRRARAMAGR